jgi:hypothetical protein
MPARESFHRPFMLLLMSAWSMTAARAESSADLLAKLEAAVTREDEKTSVELWQRLSPDFDRLSRAEQARFLVVQGLIQEDIRRDINSADQSFNRAISLLDTEASPGQALADAYYERAYIKYIRTNDTAVYCPDREKAVALTRKLDTRSKLPKYLTALSFCY